MVMVIVCLNCNDVCASVGHFRTCANANRRHRRALRHAQGSSGSSLSAYSIRLVLFSNDVFIAL